MLADVKNTIKQSFIYGLSRISSKLAAFILLPFISLNLTVSQYGIYILTESLWQILWSVYLFGLESGVLKQYLATDDLAKKKKFLFSVTVFLFISNLLFNLAVLYFQQPLSILIYEDIAYYKLVLYASLIASAETFVFMAFLVLRIEEKAKIYSIFSILLSVITLSLQIYFLQFTAPKLEGIFIAKIISPTLIFLLLIPYYFKHLRFGLENQMLRQLIRYSFPVMLAGFVITLLNQVDRYILGHITNLKDVGIYGLAYNISGVINFLIISPFSLAFAVISWKKLTDSNAQRFYTKSITYLFFAVIYLSAVISLFTPHLIKVITLRTDYWIASKYVPLVILSMPFYGMHFIGVFSFYVTGKTKYVLYSYLVALIINIGLNFLIIPHFSVYGASFVNLVSFVGLNVSIYIFSKQNYYFSYEWQKIIMMFVCYVIIVTPFFYFTFESRILEIILKLAAILFYPLILFLFKFFEPIEIITIRRFISKYLLKTNP